MNVKKLDHVGIAVESIEEALKFYEGILGVKCTGVEEVPSQKVKTAFLPLGESELELLESTDPEGSIGKFISKKGPGLHHIALRVENLQDVLNELKEKGVRLIDERPRPGAGGAKIAFVHPKASNGILLELCER